MDWHRFFSNYPGDAPPFLSIIHSNIVTQKDDKPISVESASILYRLRYASREMRWTLIEEYLKEIIAQELRLDIEQIGEDADLIQLGMDSLIFLNIAHVLAKELRIKLTAQEIFETSSISAMARCVEEKIESLPDSGEADLAVISKTTITPDPAGRHLPFDLTDIQQAYWVGRSGELELGNVGCHTYFETDSDELDIERYTAAWRRLIDRHDMLRVVFLPNGQQRIIEKVPPYEIKFLDLKDAPPEIAELKLKTIREKMSHQVLKTSEWPLFEVRATRMATGKIRIHVSLDLLIADVDSLLVLMKELAELYNNPDMFHDPLELSFRDYVMAEAGLRESDLYKRSEAYWMKRLPSIPQAPELPLATNPRHIVKPRFTRRTFRLSPETWSLLKNRASEAGLTASGILICAYAEVLSHWSKSPRFTINLTLFNRLDLHPQISRIVGDFTSVTLLETFEFPDLSFKERAQALQKRLWNDMEHRYFSGIRVLRALGQNGKTHLGASMPVVFTSNIRSGFNSTDHSPVTTVGEMVYSISQTPQVWLDSQVMEEVGELKVWWDTVEDLFPRGLVGEMFNAYHGLLMELAENIYAWREKRPYRLSGKLLERRLAVNNTAARISPEMLHTLFTMRAAERGEKTAVICSDRTLCYRELSNRSNQLAFILRERGALPNTLVAVVMEKGWEQVVAVLSVLLSGAAYLPIEPSVPEERRMHILQNGDVRFVLTQSALKSDLKWPETVECFSVDEMEPKEGEFRAPEPIQTPEDLAYVIYTSGSTGLSKGVMIDHRGAVNTILDVNNRFSMGNEDRVLALSSLSFDLSVFDIFGVLAAGGAIVMPENRRRKDPAHWLDLIIRERITVWNSVPTLMQMLVEYIKDRQEVLPPTLRLLLLSGDWIPMDLPDRVKALFKGIEVVSLGGATEASIWSILYPIESIDPQWKSIPYGRPMRNQRFYVLNEFMEACPDWVTGQLYIGGIGLAKGYWRDEEKTVASFVSHPDTGERLYRTGDLGCFWPDGNIEFMGREDFQVKISGYRIELGEIEASLRLHPSVRDAVVVAAGNQTGGRYLLGYVEAVDGEKIEPDCLKNFLRKKLADYMIPRDVMILDRLPLTPNGKIDRVALPLPKRIFLKSEHQSTAPQNKMEEMIAGVVREVLDVDGADVHDKFFNLGADSLKITVMRNKLSKLSGQDISVLSLFEHPTISDLAQFINCETGRCDSFDRVHKRTESRKKAARKRRRF
jgi:amino acid adenylation domain-containing protein